jgi:hypothetical protein
MNKLDVQDDLDRLGDVLRAATAVDLARGGDGGAARPRARWRRPRVIAGAALVAAIAIPGGAALAGAFDSAQQVAQSLPAGVLALQGVQTTCTVVTAGERYECTTATPPSDASGIAAGAWLATVEPTIDPQHTVNGGCRSLNANGTEWDCYLGQAAVDQKIIGEGFLGQPAGPSRG